jgi:hypothetical protein
VLETKTLTLKTLEPLVVRKPVPAPMLLRAAPNGSDVVSADFPRAPDSGDEVP